MAKGATHTAVRRLGRMAVMAMPLLAVGLLCFMLGLLYLYADREARETETAALLTDSLWTEQALHFQLSADEETLARLALEAGRAESSPQAMRPALAQFLTANPEVIALRWQDEQGMSRLVLPPDAAPVPPGVLDDVLARERRASRRLRYTEARRAPDGKTLVDMVAPVAHADSGVQLLVATVALDTLFDRHVPWWIAERYDVRLLGAQGEVLAAKPRGTLFDERQMHAMDFGVPVPGAVLQIARRSPKAPDGDRLLLAAVAGLAAMAVLSLLFMQRHLRRRQAAERALGMEIAFRRAMEDSLTVGMRARDRQGRITYVNPAFCRMVGLRAEDLVGLGPPMPYWDPSDLEHTRAMHDRVLVGEAPPDGFELRFRRADGSLFDVLIYEAPLIDAQGEHAGWLASVVDVTERKRAEERAQAQEASLQRTARLVTMGEMASTLAHELNQPLAAIASYAAGSLNLIRNGKAEPARLEEALEKLGVQARRAGHIIRRVHDFVRKSEPRIVPCAPENLIRESADFAEAEARKHKVRIDLFIRQPLPEVAADPILIQQVLLNLIRNGMEAMHATRRQDRVLALVAHASAEGVEINVEDRGSGVPESLRERLFEPFVSTKPDGMGMGLNICRSIMELHKGRLDVAERKGGGAVFTLSLPLAQTLERA